MVYRNKYDTSTPLTYTVRHINSEKANETGRETAASLRY